MKEAHDTQKVNQVLSRVGRKTPRPRPLLTPSPPQAKANKPRYFELLRETHTKKLEIMEVRNNQQSKGNGVEFEKTANFEITEVI